MTPYFSFDAQAEWLHLHLYNLVHAGMHRHKRYLIYYCHYLFIAGLFLVYACSAGFLQGSCMVRYPDESRVRNNKTFAVISVFMQAWYIRFYCCSQKHLSNAFGLVQAKAQWVKHLARLNRRRGFR